MDTTADAMMKLLLEIVMDQYEDNMQQRKYHDMEPISEIDHILKNKQSLRNSVFGEGHQYCIFCKQRGRGVH